MICHLLAMRPISHIVQKTLSFLHSTKIEQITKTMVMFKTGAIFLCCIRYYPIPPQNVRPAEQEQEQLFSFKPPLSETVLKHSTCFFPLYISGGSRGRARGARPPYFVFYQTEARRAKKRFFKIAPSLPPYHRVWMTETPLYLKVWIRHCICYQYGKLIFKGKIFSIKPKHDNIRHGVTNDFR